MKQKSVRIQYAENGYILNIENYDGLDPLVFVYDDEVNVLESIKCLLDLDSSDTIEVKRK